MNTIICFSHHSYKVTYFMICHFILFSVISCSNDKNYEEVSFTTSMQNQFDNDIGNAIAHLDSLQNNPKKSADSYIKSRGYFKKIEPVLSFLELDNYNFFNQPNILKIEEEDRTDIKVKNPEGYQVLEEEIFTKNPDTSAIVKHSEIIKNRLKMIRTNKQFDHLKKYHFLWMFRKAFVRVALTGISGFDSPVLENSLIESSIVYKSLENYLDIFKNEFEDKKLYVAWKTEILNSRNALNIEFNTFDRYHFIKNHTHRQLLLWNRTVKDWKVIFPFELAIKNDASSLFSDKTFTINYFTDSNSGNMSTAKIKLGEKLFNDKNLSQNKQISCATCHQSDKAFTDGLKIRKGLTRNSPTLLYAALQQSYFYDKSAGSLEGQIVSVVNNDAEFHTNLEDLEKTVQQDGGYQEIYELAYPTKKIEERYIRNAIASYIRSLAPFNSKFDANINSIESTITQQEINGFNLFHGKAKCATCHFPPLYNGTVPPDYQETELELIGVPEHNDTINATISTDLGRYEVYKTSERKHFFKTSTIRNVSLTAPYMHNGVYTTLFEVMDFYNRGGGIGIGIVQENQTLPLDPLGLTKQEMQDVIAFMESLEDRALKKYVMPVKR